MDYGVLYGRVAVAVGPPNRGGVGPGTRLRVFEGVELEAGLVAVAADDDAGLLVAREARGRGLREDQSFRLHSLDLGVDAGDGGGVVELDAVLPLRGRLELERRGLPHSVHLGRDHFRRLVVALVRLEVHARGVVGSLQRVVRLGRVHAHRRHRRRGHEAALRGLVEARVLVPQLLVEGGGLGVWQARHVWGGRQGLREEGGRRVREDLDLRGLRLGGESMGLGSEGALLFVGGRLSRDGPAAEPRHERVRGVGHVPRGEVLRPLEL